MIFFREITVQEPASIICDRCGRRAENDLDHFDFQEYLLRKRRISPLSLGERVRVRDSSLNYNPHPSPAPRFALPEGEGATLT
jgi:hypothetical protein